MTEATKHRLAAVLRERGLQQLFEECWSAMLAASNPKEEGSDNCD